MKRTLVFSLLALAAVVAASLAYAAIPSGNGTITACVDSKGGLKLIDADAGATCGGGKTPLTWNQQGPEGPQGPAGPAGPEGPAGPGGITDIVTVVQTSTANSDDVKFVIAVCPAGLVAINGRAQVLTPNAPAFLREDGFYSIAGAPYSGHYGVAQEVTAYDGTWQLRISVMCASLN